MSRLPIDTPEIRALAEILADTGLTEIEVSDGDSRVRVARTPAPVACRPMTGAPPHPPGRRPAPPIPIAGWRTIPARSPARWWASSTCRPSRARRPS